MDLNHFCHEHPLVFIEGQSLAIFVGKEDGEEALCFGCWKPLEGSSYYCSSCQFCLHKTCAELEFAPEIKHHLHPSHPLRFLPESPYHHSCYRCDFCLSDRKGFVYHCASCDFNLDINCASLGSEINHPLHPSHPLIFLPESPYPHGYYFCNFCHGACWESLFHCASCNFSLDIKCALRHLSIADNFPKLEHFSHEHPLIFIEEQEEDVPAFCFGCDKRLSGSIYRCLQCTNFDLHKECAEVARTISGHFLHRQHTVTLLEDPPVHPETCTCLFCKRHYEGFVYHCNLCTFTRPLKDFFKPTMVDVGDHNHPVISLQRQIAFICDFCGKSGDSDPYICHQCQILLHESCFKFPKIIRIARHQSGWCDCNICYEEINPEFGSYSCSVCNYYTHVNCAVQMFNHYEGDVLMESENLITTVFGEMSLEKAVASEVKHVYHEHNLILTFSGEVKGGDICDGCSKPVSVPFYSCGQCRFLLDKNCAELPRQNQLPIHKHLLNLTKNGFARCHTCGHYHHGFSYKCDRKRCGF